VCRRIGFLRTSSGLLGLSFLLVLPACYGQTVSATLRGTVTDSTGAVVPEAVITATNVATGLGTKSTSDASGDYIFPSLVPSTYNLNVEKTGFKSTVISGITLQVDQKARVDIMLQVGQVSTMVQVRGAAPLVDTTTATVGTVVGEQQIVDLPLNLRRVEALATLAPGTVASNGFTSSVFGSTFAETSYISNGTHDASNLIVIDGIASRTLLMGGASIQPPPEMVQEFKIQTNTYSAAFGEVAGSTINLVTKSGTNVLHGDAWEFLRNDKLDARNFFAANQTDPFTGKEIPGSARPEFRRNQFGLDVGGPMRRDKTFFFGGYEGMRQIQGQTEGNFVPTDAEKRGDFSSFLTGRTVNLCGSGGPANLNFDSGQLFDPASEQLFTCPAGSALAGSPILVGKPISGNVITSIDPVAQKVLPHFPEPNRPGYPNFVNQLPIRRNDDQFDVRIDHTLGPRDQIFARYLLANTYEISNQLGTTLPGIVEFVHYRAQNTALGWTHIVGPHLLNEVRVGWNRNYNFVNCIGCPRAPGTIESFGIKNLHPFSAKNIQYPFFSFANFAPWGDTEYQPDIDPDMTEQYADNLTWTHGRHTVSAGVKITYWQSLGLSGPFWPAGNFNYDGRFSSLAGEPPDVSGVADLADFELGFPALANDTFKYSQSYPGRRAVAQFLWSR